jgi:hypothetical protein
LRCCRTFLCLRALPSSRRIVLDFLPRIRINALFWFTLSASLRTADRACSIRQPSWDQVFINSFRRYLDLRTARFLMCAGGYIFHNLPGFCVPVFRHHRDTTAQDPPCAVPSNIKPVIKTFRGIHTDHGTAPCLPR